MKKLCILFITCTMGCLVFVKNGYSQVTVGGAGANYSTLKSAFDAVNAGTLTGAITLQVTGSTTETASAALNASGAGNANYTSVKIYPVASGYSISGSLAAPLINLNGADNITIDGRVNQLGAANLLISNSSTSAVAGTSTIRFINDATNNIIKYCTLKGSSTDGNSGIIFFSNTTGSTGNDGNVIDNNNITNSVDANRPLNTIFSAGTSAKDNSGNTFSNNNIFDFLNKSTASNGINLASNTTGETITGNSFYETTSFGPAVSVAYSIIKINNASGTGYTISGNYIGGNQASCGGSAWLKTNSADNLFYAINLNVGTIPETSLQNNTIRNFSWSNSGAAAWVGIQITVGSVNTGTVNGNTIGSATGNSSIAITGGANGTNVYGIYIQGSGTNFCQNNTIGSITADNSDATCASNVYAIYRFNTGINTFSNNLIGSTTTSNSIQAISASSANAQSVIGFFNTTGGTFNVNNNIIANLANSTTNSNPATSGVVDGIASVSAINNITNNTIRDLSIANANNSSTNTAAICGIALSSSNSLNTITGNSIFNLVNSYVSFTGNVIALYFGSTGSSHIVSGTFIHGLSVTGASSTGSVYGIKINTGAATYYNNIISLGGNTATSVYGIYETGTSGNNNNLYFNTVYIGGTPVTGALNSYALFSAVSTNSRNFRNNIFSNTRSNNGAAGNHYAAYFNYTVNTNLTLDYNDYYAPGNGGKLGYYNNGDVSSLPLVTGKDAWSLTFNPLFASPGGTTATDYIPASDKLEGLPLSYIATDYLSAIRAGTPTMGAFEGILNLNVAIFKSGLLQTRFTLLKYAFDKINDGTITGALEIRISGNTTESATAVLYQSGYVNAGSTSNYSSIIIYPIINGVAISGSLDAPLISLNGADNVIIDGRVNATGSTTDLTLKNTSTGTSSSNSTILFSNSAENNDIKYCNIYGSCVGTSTGMINFSSASSGNGNDNDIIENCNISSTGGNRPFNTILSNGTATRENSGNIIRNNNIFNFFNPAIGSYGINIASNSSGYFIYGNSFYETTTVVPTASVTFVPIRVTTGDGNLITTNYIGGSAPQCAGSAYTVNSNATHYFCGIYIGCGTGTTITVQDNIIQNINYTSTQANPWDGIFINSGNVNVTGNTIGATTGTGSIVISTPAPAASTLISGGQVTAITLIGGGSGYVNPPIITFTPPPAGGTLPTATATITGGTVTLITLNTQGSGYTTSPSVIFNGQTNGYSTSHGMIQNSTGTVNITSNNIGSITTEGSAYYSQGFESIYVRGIVATTTFSNNVIGSLTTANSINTSSTAALSLTKQDVYGIYSSGTGTTIITGNTVANLTNGYTGLIAQSRTRGIQTTAGSNTIQNNTVRNLTTSSKQSSAGTAASVIGISQICTTAATTQTLSGNTVFSLSNNSPTGQVFVTGVFYTGPATGYFPVSGNFIHSLSVASSDLTASIRGIEVNNGSVTCCNNIVSLGDGIIGGYKINGIWDESISATYVKSILFNSVYIGGSISSGTTSSTYALWNQANYATRDYRNNVLCNVRTGGSTGKHYAVYLNGTSGLTINFNDYFVSGTNSALGYLGSEKGTLALFKAATGQDANSLSINPDFTTPGGTSATDYYSSALLPAIPGTGISVDYTGAIRNPTPKMGALERTIYTWKGAINTDFSTAANWTVNEVPAAGANIVFDTNPTNNCVLDQNRTVGDITNPQSIKNMVINGKKLTINGNLNFTNGAQIDASATTSTVEFAGAAAQSIPSGAFYNDEVYNLTVNNANNIVLNGTLHLLNTLTATSGRLDGFTNSPSVNYAGTSPQTIGSNLFLNDILYNLTIGNANGVILNTDLTVNNSLTINPGALFLISPAKKLNVIGILTNNAGSSGFVLQSNATGTASLLHHTDNVPATVQRCISGITEAWHFISSPVSDQRIGGSWLPSGTYVNGTGYDLYLWHEPISDWIAKTDSISPVNWKTVHPGNNFMAGRAYLYAVQVSNPIKSFVGNLNNGPLTFGLTTSGTNPSWIGFNMMGNPYPSSVDWQAVTGWSRTNLVSNGGGYDMWIWNPDANNYGVCNSSDGSVGTNSITRYIAPMQGYFVRASGAGILSMDNPVRVLEDTHWFKNPVQNDNKISLSVNADSGYGFDEILLGFGYPVNENGAMKLFSSVPTAPSLYVTNPTKDFSVIYYTNTKQNPVVPVSFKPGENGHFTINCNFDQSKFDSVLLEDLQTQYTQNMKATKTYSFQASTMDDTNRFILHFGPEKKHSGNELPARIYSDATHLIVDLLLVPEETEVFVYDVIGRLLFSQTLIGGIQHTLTFDADAQMLVVYLKNPNGSLCRKLLFGNNRF